MNASDPRPAGITLAQALQALRDDLEAQQPPPSVLAAARQAARQQRPLQTPFGQRERAATVGVAPSDAPGRGVGGVGAWLAAWLGGRAGAHRTEGPDLRIWAGAATCAVVLGVSLLLALRPPQMAPARPSIAGIEPQGALPSVPSGEATTQVAAPSPDANAQASLMPAMHFVPLVSPERLRALTGGDAAGEGTGSAHAGRGGSRVGHDAPAWVLTTELPQERLAAMGLPYDPARAAERLRAELLVAGSGEVLAVRLIF